MIRSISRFLRLTALVGIVVAVAAPASAGAAQIAPPGKAGASQYFETIPTSRGNVAPPTGGAKSPTETPTLVNVGAGRSGLHRLNRLGRDGKSAGGFAQATSPSIPALSSGRLRSLERSPGGSALGGIAALLSGSDAGGIGLVLPLMLAITLLAVGAPAASRLLRREQR